jgi:hypothetical protein
MWRAALVLALLGLSSAARADSPFVDPAERRLSPYVGDPDKCDDEHILTRIQGVWKTTQDGIWRTPQYDIDGFDRIREISFRGDGTEYIPKRYCIARAHLADNSVHTAIYRIEEGQGIIGFGDGVEYCIVGLDRLFAYSPACAALRPMAERFLGSKALVERY